MTNEIDWNAFREDNFDTLRKAYGYGLPLPGNVKYLKGYELGHIKVGDVRYELTANTIDYKSKLTAQNGYIYLAPRVGLAPAELASVGRSLTQEEINGSFRTSPGIGLPVSDEILENLKNFQTKIHELVKDHIRKYSLEEQAHRNTGFWQNYENAASKTNQR